VFFGLLAQKHKKYARITLLTISFKIDLTENHVEASEITKLAQLARINIETEMVDEVTESISRILNLVDQLQAADTTDIEPMSHPMDAVQRLRADIVTEVVQRDELQANAPAVANGLFLVPKVID
jgi:aspartyl-tRNA(Asn)/glutamyl-tRNA(Gln) amidotransferase subunit C